MAMVCLNYFWFPRKFKQNSKLFSVNIAVVATKLVENARFAGQSIAKKKVVIGSVDNVHCKDILV
jgi:hypothetical protein